MPEGPVTWRGQKRPPLEGRHVYPKTAAGLKAWIAVGGTPESVVRAAQYGMPLMLAIIGGPAERFVPWAELHRKALAELGHEGTRSIAVHSPGHVAETDDEAREQLFPSFKENRDRIGAERGWGPVSRADFEREAKDGALYVGSPETVAQKIARTVKLLDLDRFDLKYSNGPMPHAMSMRAIELYGRKVIPRVREILGRPAAADPSAR